MSSTLTLNADGTGTIAMPPVLPSQPVSWKEEKGQVTIQNANGAPAGGANGTAPKPNSGGGAGYSLTGSIAEDGKTMVIPVRSFSLTLTKQEPAK